MMVRPSWGAGTAGTTGSVGSSSNTTTGTRAVGSVGSPTETSPDESAPAESAASGDPEGAAAAQAPQPAPEGRGRGAGGRDHGGQVCQHDLVARRQPGGDLGEGGPDGTHRDGVLDLLPLAELVDEAR